jgi:putative ABC transport system permease protein
MSDIRYALRSFLKTPLFTAVVLLTLALGIGVNTAMFSVVNAVLLEPLPYPRAEELVRVRRGSSFPDMTDWAAQARSFSGVAGYRPQLFDFDTGDVPERTDGAFVTGGLFDLLGGRPLLGRLIDNRDQSAGSPHVVVVSERFWRTRLGSRPEAVGRPVSFNDTTYQLLGVVAGGFELPGDKADVFAPFYPENPQEAEARGAHTLRGLLRLKPGVTISAAQSELDALAKGLELAYPATNRQVRFILLPLNDSLVGSMRSALWILLGTVSFVLLIACVNVANLLIARAAARRGEMAVRAALGASPARLGRQLVSESLLLAVAGGGIGLGIGFVLTRAIARLAPDSLPRVDRVALDGRVLLFTLAASLVTGLLFGVLPSWIASRSALADAAREGARGSARQRVRSVLMIAEIALALVLVSGTGLLLRSFSVLVSQPLGFDADHLLTGNVKLSAVRYRDIGARTRFFAALERELDAMPGVSAVGLVTEMPIGSDPLMHNLAFEGRPMAHGTEPEIFYRGVNAGYFRTIGISLLRGRGFSPADTASAPPVAIANEAFAREYYAGEDVVGRRVRWASGNGEWMTIVGVVPDVRGVSLETGEVPALYVPYAQERNWWRMWMDVVVRTSGDPSAFAPSLRVAAARVDRTVPIARIRSMDAVVSASTADRQFNLFLIGAFAALALVLAAAGTYGVMAYLVTQRYRELGIRIALGARPQAIMALVMGHALRLGVAGAAVGLVAWWFVARALQGMLFGVTAADPRALLGATLTLLSMTMLACYGPARRASRVDPLVVLRSE